MLMPCPACWRLPTPPLKKGHLDENAFFIMVVIFSIFFCFYIMACIHAFAVLPILFCWLWCSLSRNDCTTWGHLPWTRSHKIVVLYSFLFLKSNCTATLISMRIVAIYHPPLIFGQKVSCPLIFVARDSCMFLMWGSHTYFFHLHISNIFFHGITDRDT